MSRRHVVALWVCVSGLAATAFGQADGVTLSRPSDNGPSTEVGQVGGSSTRYTPSIQSLRTRTPLEDFRQGLSRFSVQNRALPSPELRLPGAFSLSNPGVPPDDRGPDYFAQTARGGVSIGRLMEVSSLDMYFSDSAPLLDPLGPEILVFDLPPLPPDHRSSYEKFFDLKPEPEAPGDVPQRTLVDIAEEESLARRAPLRQAALESFKQGTADIDSSAEAPESLAHALILLRNTLRLDDNDTILYLLIAQGELERGHLQVVYATLVDAVQRHPAIFAARVDLSAYYGDPKRLTATVRRGLRMGVDANDVNGYAMAGFSAWVGGDAVRLKQAIDGLETATRLTEGDVGAHGLVRSLRAGLIALE